MVAAGTDLSELHGIGKDLAGKINEIVETGGRPVLDETERRVPESLLELLTLGPLGPKRVKTLHDQLGIKGLADLEVAAKAGKIHDLRGFGTKMEERLLDALAHHVKEEPRPLLTSVEGVAEDLARHLSQATGVGKVVVAGSYRRRKETVGDLDILVTAARDSDVMERFVGFEAVEEVLGHGRTRSTVRLRSGLQVDVRVVPQESYGAAQHYFTGSKAHNIAVRSRGVERGLKINEYGVFRKDEAQIARRTEEEVYAEVGLPYIEPELREKRGEIEAAFESCLPQLITLADIKGDLHAHTTETDGRASLEEMAEGARAKGYRYLAITDHSQRVAMARGLDAKRLARQIKAIYRLNARLEGLVILRGSRSTSSKTARSTCRTRSSRSLICGSAPPTTTSTFRRKADRAHHPREGQPLLRHHRPSHRTAAQQARSVRGRPRAGHAGGARARLLPRAERPAGPARPQRCALQDGQGAGAQARDLDRRAQRRQLTMRFGIDQARRGWLERADVLNTRSWPQLKSLLRRA